MFAPCCEHQQRLGFRMHCLPAVQQDVAQCFPQGSAAGFPRDHHIFSSFLQEMLQPPEMRRLTRTVNAFQSDEFAPHIDVVPELPYWQCHWLVSRKEACRTESASRRV